MNHRTRVGRARHAMRVAAALGTWILLASSSQAQGPQIDLGAPPGEAGGSSLVGQPLGQANFPDFGSPSNAPFTGRVGSRGSHVPASALAAPGVPVFKITGAQAAITQNAQPLQVPQVGDLKLTSEFEDYPIGGGPPGNMNLDAAIDQLVRQNLDLLAAKLEVPMAEADVVTANLRANPIFYADTQLIPYGHFSFLRPGGPPQSDINISYPLDITFKRLARTNSAREAKSSTEAQLQDAVRNQIDNLYTIYEGVVAAGLTLQFSEKYYEGISKVLGITEKLYRDGQIQESDMLAVKTNVYKAALQIKESRVAKIKANRALALMLNLPLDDVDKLDVRDPVGRPQRLPMTRDELVKKALAIRPDLLAYRFGLRRAQADLRLARANGYPDVYVLYQPYTLQNNTYLGVPSAYSWTLGVTATIPLYNRNQGNVTRAKVNITQTDIQVASAERLVMSDVLNAAQELEQSLVAVTEFKQQILPDAEKVLLSALRRFTGGQTSALEYLAAQQDYNDLVRAFRDAVVRHRAAILDLNTAVGERVLP
jgi:outer membrane protein, heavy metal efflux system